MRKFLEVILEIIGPVLIVLYLLTNSFVEAFLVFVILFMVKMSGSDSHGIS